MRRLRRQSATEAVACHALTTMDESNMEVIYTWNMDFNTSTFGSATALVPLATLPPTIWIDTSKAPPTSAPTSTLAMSAWAHGSWVFLFAGMLVVAIGGNAIVIWIVTAHRRMRTVTNYFLVNLSLADLLMASLNCLFNFIYMLQSDWVFGVRYCKLSNFIANVTVAASVFTLTGISFDRFQAIVRPMRPRMSKTCSLVVIGFIWLGGMLLAFPCLLYSNIVTYKHRGQIKTACILIWPDGTPDVSYFDFIYQVVIFVVTYAVPMFAMVVFYTGMGRVLWGSRSIGELTQRQLDSMRSKRKVVRMFILVIAIFGICWLPYQFYFIYTHLDPGIMYKSYIQHVYLGFYWLAMANAMVNPIIYYWMNAKFRSYFRSAMCGWRSLLPRSRSPAPESPPIARRSHSHSHSRSRSGMDDENKNLTHKGSLTYEIRFLPPPKAATMSIARTSHTSLMNGSPRSFSTGNGHTQNGFFELTRTNGIFSPNYLTNEQSKEFYQVLNGKPSDSPPPYSACDLLPMSDDPRDSQHLLAHHEVDTEMATHCYVDANDDVPRTCCLPNNVICSGVTLHLTSEV